jgi:NADP-dependent 3-hydroxy acid dehydrogenase YdfG
MAEKLQGKIAMVIGASSGLGWATSKKLVDEGYPVISVARGKERLFQLKQDLGSLVQPVIGDATDEKFIDNAVREYQPDLVVLTAGATPVMKPIDSFDWETFSQTWNQDVKAAFNVVRSTLRNLKPGSVVVIVSSGAAADGSPLSGGYAGAKKTQWFLADYAQIVSNAKQRGLRFVTVLPRPVRGTTIGRSAARAYGAQRGITEEAFMDRIGVSTEQVADVILRVFRGELGVDTNALVVGSDGGE